MLDPLESGFDPSPLAAVLADPAVEIVLHAGRQDAALLRRVWDTRLHNIFDTQVAAGFAGLRAQLGYEGLLREILGVRLQKSASFTRWDQRPLSAEQVEYAREDVLHLLALAQRLQERLADQGRLEWAREECAFLEDISDDREIDALFAKLPRVNSLDPGRRAIARELVALARGGRAAGGPPGVDRASGRDARRDRQAPAAVARAPGPHPRPQRGHAAPPRAGRCSRRSSAAASGRRSRSSASARRIPTRSTRRSSRSPRRSSARGRSRRSSPTSCSPRAPTSSGSCSRPVTASPSPTCGPCAAGAASSSARSCSRC